MTRGGLLVYAAVGASCASYGWADRPAAGGIARPVTVRTVDVDAHAGVDAAALTRALIDELRRAGVVGAAWSGADAPADVIACDVAVVDDAGFGEHTFVSVSTRCAVDGFVVTERRGDAQVGLRATARHAGRSAAADSAARASFADVAHDLARHLRGGS